MSSNPRHRAVRFVSTGVLALMAALAVPFTSHGQTHLLSATATSANLADLRQWDARVDAMTRSGDLRMRESTADPLVPGRVHERLDQYYRGIRVWGGDLARQSERGVSISVFG